MACLLSPYVDIEFGCFILGLLGAGSAQGMKLAVRRCPRDGIGSDSWPGSHNLAKRHNALKGSTLGKEILAKLVSPSPFSSYVSSVGLLRTQGGVVYVSGLNRVKSTSLICKG